MDDKYLDLMDTEMEAAAAAPTMKNLSLPLASASTSSLSEDKKAAYATKRATAMFGCYRKDEANDPAVYMAAAVGILMKYPVEVITAVTDPISGLPSTSKFLPALAEIKSACEMEDKKLAKDAYYERWDKRMQKSAPKPPVSAPNLFVPEGFRYYEAMMERHQQTEGKRSRVERRKCEFDGVVRLGIWVPLHWIDELNKKT